LSRCNPPPDHERIALHANGSQSREGEVMNRIELTDAERLAVILNRGFSATAALRKALSSARRSKAEAPMAESPYR
jgi:hypothetical protein